MSAQAGVWCFDSFARVQDALGSFSRTLRRYGPDGEHIEVNGCVGMYYGASHTTLESCWERQPYSSDDGLFTWDGRLDNRDSLIVELGLKRRPLSDLDIVSEAFHRWGADCFRRFVGDWA